MRAMQDVLHISTRGRGFHDISRQVQALIQRSGITCGLANLFIQHTSASLLINENADPQVLRDLDAYFERLMPDGDALFRHTAEGPDDMPAHVRSALTQTSLNVPVQSGRLALGTWQGIYLWEHRHAPHARRVVVSVQELRTE